ncbi:TPA: hypothetical protein N0F65_004673 [Lagenidium giganteum]|uniref:Glycoside hydrolase 5 subfamily 27 n=3 Tax=Oomycota TaxID=4762 RepID=A0A077B4G0_9STRA|nr:glycoside hydrolase 5 subfamily 27 [Lagenidium giganteum]DBA00768.1 TPA: hypothetical protein N0F65_004673 [Lagenidium giganteum]
MRLQSALLPLFAATALASENVISVDPATHHFVDGLGRTRIFHGVNVVEKAPPYHPVIDGDFDTVRSMVQQDFDYLNSWGMNVVRLGAMWTGVEPTPGEYNQTYIDVLVKLVDDLGKNGIYTMVDFHQDLFSPVLCGDGIPGHVVKALEPLKTKCNSIVGGLASLAKLCKSFSDYKFTIGPDGNPTDCGKAGNWFNIYMTPEVASAFDKFYNSEAATDSLVNYFVKLAKAFKNSPYALGFDLFNEPFPGDVYNKPWLLQGGKADREYLQPLYEKIQAAIRKEDASKIMFYEPVQFPDTFPLFGGIVSNAGFTQAPGGKALASTNAMSYHIYCCEAGADICPSGDVSPNKDARCDDYVTEKFNKRTEDFKRLGGAGFITEFGACSNKVQCVKEINRVANNADRDMQSWMYWQYKFHDTSFYNGDGTNMTWKINALARPYAQAVMGVPEIMRFDPATSAFRLKYHAKTGDAPTEVYVNPTVWYQQGYDAILSAGTTINRELGYKIELVHGSDVKADSVVDFAMVPKTEDKKGEYRAKHATIKYAIDWAVENDAALDTIAIVLSKSYHWRKEIRVFSDSGEKVCEVSLTGSYSGVCKIPVEKRNDFLFGFKIELYKYYVFDKLPVFVDSFRPSYLGPLSAGKRVKIDWKSED